jgi:AbrB family looped-hinge helix DNA binding protein
MGYANSMITTITGKNQVTVPAAIASRVNIHPGTRLDWEVGRDKETLIVRVLPDPGTLASRLRGSGRKYRRPGVSAVRNLIRERADDDKR